MRTIFFLLLSVALLSSCHFMGGRRVHGNGNPGSENRSVSSFESLRAVGGMDVIISPGTDYTARVEADENLLKYILTDRDGNALVIRTRDGYNLRSRTPIKVYITTPSIEELVITGSGTVISNGKLTANRRLRVHVTGSGDVKVDVNAPEVSAEATGSGNIILTGNTRNFNAEINGSGEMRCFNLLSENTEVRISGSGSAEVYASKQLEVRISGSGDVAYKGSPAINQHIAGSGSVRSTP
jgi:hypothetical protein